MKYRPDIDGLRSVAVLSVLFFHLGATWLPGGFIGVDVFFVISGYLITRNLTVQIERGGGLSLIDFYDRRIRRIAPAALTLLVVTLLAGYFLLMPGDYASLGKSTIYSAFGAGNLFFFWHTGYFDREASLQPLLHMWSLGVEEQFYAAWPMLLALILWIAKHRRGLTIGMIAAVSAISFVLCLQELTTSPKAAFYLPNNRAWELGVGALVVFVPTLRSRLTAEGGSRPSYDRLWPLHSPPERSFSWTECGRPGARISIFGLAKVHKLVRANSLDGAPAMAWSDLVQPVPMALAAHRTVQALGKFSHADGC
jgi:peptidoglycan/LPS O-acetylase OafA/YrhL